MLRKKCEQCGGDGIYTTQDHPSGGVSMPCPWPGCVEGWVVYAKILLDPGLDDIMDSLADAMNRFDDISEKIDEVKAVVDAL